MTLSKIPLELVNMTHAHELSHQCMNILKLMYAFHHHPKNSELLKQKVIPILYYQDNILYDLKQKYPDLFSHLEFNGPGWGVRFNNIRDKFEIIQKLLNSEPSFGEIRIIYTRYIEYKVNEEQSAYFDYNPAMFISRDEELRFLEIADEMYKLNYKHTIKYTTSQLLNIALSDCDAILNFFSKKEYCDFHDGREQLNPTFVFLSEFSKCEECEYTIALHDSLPGLSSLAYSYLYFFNDRMTLSSNYFGYTFEFLFDKKVASMIHRMKELHDKLNAKDPTNDSC